MINRIRQIFSRHPKLTGLTLVLILGAGLFAYRTLKSNSGQTRYVTSAVEKGTLVVTVSGSGQVASLDQLDLKAKASGDVTYLGVSDGQTVSQGKLLVQLDDSDAQKSVRDAQANLTSAKLALEKLQQPATALQILQAENALAQANETKQSAQDDLQKAYDDGFNAVANAFLDLPTVMSGLQDTLLGYGFTPSQRNLDYYADAVRTYDETVSQYRDDALNKFQVAHDQYDRNWQDYKGTSRYATPTVIEALVNETYNTTKALADSVKSANNLIQFYKDTLTERNLTPKPLADTHLNNLDTYTSETNTNLSALLNIESTIQNDQDAIVNADRSIAEKTTSLADLKAGADPLDVQSQELTIQQRQNALTDAQGTSADYSIYAPFNGVAAEVAVEKGDSVSTGSIVLTLLTREKVAELSLNEVDAAKVQAGQKATLTFDAVPDLTVVGTVLEINTVGTVSQGVVSYAAKITFATDNAQIKPGMSVSADIIVQAKPDVLLIPNSAVKEQNNASYVEVLPSGSKVPQSQPITTGLANDTSTEVTGGLKEGDLVVTQTVTATSARQSTSNSNLRIPGVSGGVFGR